MPTDILQILKFLGQFDHNLGNRWSKVKTGEAAQNKISILHCLLPVSPVIWLSTLFPLIWWNWYDSWTGDVGVGFAVLGLALVSIFVCPWGWQHKVYSLPPLCSQNILGWESVHHSRQQQKSTGALKGKNSAFSPLHQCVAGAELINESLSQICCKECFIWRCPWSRLYLKGVYYVYVSYLSHIVETVRS